MRLLGVAHGYFKDQWQITLSNQDRQQTILIRSICSSVFFFFFLKKAAAAALYTQRWKFAMSGGGCPSLVPQKRTWDNKSGPAVTWELPGTPAGEGAVRGGGCWDTYPMGTKLKSMGRPWGAENACLGISPSNRVWVTEPEYLSIYSVPGWALLPGLVNFLAFQAWPSGFWAEPAVCGGSETQGAETGRLLRAGTDWTVWGMWLQHWAPLPWWVQSLPSPSAHRM